VAWLPTFEQGPWGEERKVWRNAAWIATMSPDLAESLAAMLDVSANRAEAGYHTDERPHALALARAILGDYDL
jgi:hypothetical protein